MRNLLIYGGTFDPIHNGHINTAINVQNYFNFDRFIFLPCKIPVLKNKAIATAAQRIDMINLALLQQDKDKHFALDLSEINRDSPSYMVDSLQNFRDELGDKIAITLLMGADTFNQLPHWHAWHRLLTLANILVIKRPGFNEAQTPSLENLLDKHETEDKNALCQQAQGVIYRYDAGSFNFSSSWIRKQFAEGKTPQGYLPEPVLQYIKQNNLYFKLY